MRMKVLEKVESKKGFYIGDICYVLSDDIYYGVWGGKHGFGNGSFQDPETGLWVAVAGTYYGDGCYIGSDGTHFPVDAGAIGLVPLELVSQKDGLEDGKAVESPGTAIFHAEDGEFKIELPSGEIITIDTTHNTEMDDEED